MTEEELIQLLVLENASELSKVLEEPRYWGGRHGTASTGARKPYS